MSATDYLGLKNLKLFQKIPNLIPKGINKTLNVIAFKNDVFFVWNFEDICLLTLNLKLARNSEENHMDYLALLPRNSLLFSPELLLPNEECSLIAIAGPHGILLMQLPQNTLLQPSFITDKKTMYCASISLDERLFYCNKFVEVRQVKWHPDTEFNILVVLTSNNVFRFYKVNQNLTTVIKIYQIGREPMAMMAGTRIPFLVALGETAVDFDFGAPQLPKKITADVKWKDVSWPIYVLRGDGSIYILLTDTSGVNGAIINGPLPVYPFNEDSYMEDACALLSFKTVPPVLAISTSAGTIYHGILLTPNDQSEFSGKEEVIKYENCTSQSTDKVIYVFETIELELGSGSIDAEKSYICPIFLHIDEYNRGKYFCTHETGVHSVCIPAVNELEKILQIDEENLNAYLSNLNITSVAEYLLCTHAFDISTVNAVLGFAKFHSPETILVLLASGQVVNLPVSCDLTSTTEHLDLNEYKNLPSPLKNILMEPFDVHIKNIFKGNTNHPFLQLSTRSNLDINECRELLLHARETFENEYFFKYVKVSEEIIRRVNTLRVIKDEQMREIMNELNIELGIVQMDSERLKRKYKRIDNKQQELTEKCQKLLHLSNTKQLWPAPDKFQTELKKLAEKVRCYKEAIAGIKKKVEYQKTHMQNWKEQRKETPLSLGSNHLELINKHIKDMNTAIEVMCKDICICRAMLGLD